MAYADDLLKLRKKMTEALSLGLVSQENKEIYEATLLQIMNEAERQRQVCVARAEDLRKQAAIADGQSVAFTQVSSIVYNILNSYVSLAEKSKQEEADRAEELSQK